MRKFTKLEKLTVLAAFNEEEIIEDIICKVSKITTLQSLVFENGIDMGSNTWMTILHGLPHLKSLSIPAIYTKTRVETMQMVLPTLTKLTSLTILYAPQLGIATLQTLTNLQQLQFENLGDFTREEFWGYEGKYPWYLLTTFTKLQSLTLWRVKWKDDLTDMLLSMPNLKSLEISSCMNQQVFWEHLPELTSLTHLTLQDFSNITADQLGTVNALPNLQYLIFDAGFSKVPVQAFEEPQLQSMKRKVIVTEPFPTFLCAAKQ